MSPEERRLLNQIKLWKDQHKLLQDQIDLLLHKRYRLEESLQEARLALDTLSTSRILRQKKQEALEKLIQSKFGEIGLRAFRQL